LIFLDLEKRGEKVGSIFKMIFNKKQRRITIDMKEELNTTWSLPA
jgi:hypothetical protein